MTVTAKILYPNRNHSVALVDPVAFFLALILAPLLVGILGAPLLLIPSFAVLFGGLPYIVIGGPILWCALRRGEDDLDRFFGLGFKTIVILTVLIVPASIAWIFHTEGNAQATGVIWGHLIFAVLSAVFAGVWSMVFASLYRRLRNPNFPT